MNMQWIKKCIIINLSAMFVLVTAFIVFFSNAYAKDLQTIYVEVEYGQTEARSMLSAINEFRTSSNVWAWNEDNSKKIIYSGLKPLKYDYGLEQVAMSRAAEIAISYSHTRPDGSDVFSMMKDEYMMEYESAGENIAAGQTSASEVFEAWKEESEDFNGQGHRRNMINSTFGYIGIGHASCQGIDYWVQVFSDKKTDGEEYEANDQSIKQYITIDIDKTDIKIDAGEGSINTELYTWIELPKLQIKAKMAETFPDRYITVCADELEWIEDTTGRYEIFYEEVDDGVIGEICANILGPMELTARALGKEEHFSVIAFEDLETQGEVELIDHWMTYDGSEKKAEIKVKCREKTLREGDDYIVSYTNNIKPGKATVKVKGCGYYKGTLNDTFIIVPLTSILDSGSMSGEDDDLVEYTIYWAVDKEGTLNIFGDGPMVISTGQWGSGLYDNFYPWTRYKSLIKKIIVSEGITQIQGFVDLDCCTEVELPDSLRVVNPDAFAGCKSLKKIRIPNSVETIGSYSFMDCSSLEEITLSNNLKEIGLGVFWSCKKLRSISLPESLEYIGDSAFHECESINTLDLPESLTYLGPSAFSNCSHLREIVIPDSITELYNDTFVYCWSLKKVKLPSRLTRIEDSAFYMCTALEEIVIPDTVKDLGAEPSQYISHVTIGDVRGVFESCSFLNKVTMGSNISKLDDFLFRFDELEEIVYHGTKAQWRAFLKTNPSVSINVRKVSCSDGVINYKNESSLQEEETIYVKRIVLNSDISKVAQGRTAKLKYKIFPSNATSKKILWKSSNTRLAVVNAEGKVVFAKNAGGKSVIITASSADGRSKAKWKFWIMKGTVKSIKIFGKKKVKAGKTLKLKAKVKATKGANKKLKWTSSNTKWATVNGSGKVKALKAGKGKKVKITAMATDGSGKKKAVTIKIK